ncbi:sulfite exporter TauE/SafE family protein [Thiomicrorhabdus indica]|uniref:sulfite exporter TauE/SafE family protein n=1 Tax=Thiomicrorhabdus indica TaxID=2267253 RepID=UPI002AA78D89|nr:sulfite exporter TauE/SafE family protein [Thiomicrorhabdus indica]
MQRRSDVSSFLGGLSVGSLGGLIGLGGAEFRLPLLISFYGFVAVQAVILNKVMSLVVVASAIPLRGQVVDFSEVWSHNEVIFTLLAGSLIGAWLGADWVTKLANRTLYRLIAGLLVLMAVVLLWSHYFAGDVQFELSFQERLIFGILAGFAIGVVASVMGVAGGELLIPTIMLLFGADIILAGSLAIMVSLPTMLAGLARYRRDPRFIVLVEQKRFVLWMLLGSIVGVALGAWLLTLIPTDYVLMVLAGLLLLSAYKVYHHD